MLFIIEHIFSYEILIFLTVILFCREYFQKIDFISPVDTTAKLIELPMKLLYGLIDDGIHPSNNFDAVGLNTFENEDENKTFSIVSCEICLITMNAHSIFNPWSNTSNEELKNNRPNNNRLNIEHLTKQIIIN